MGIMELGAIGELVGGVAVIGSLIFVGLQIRQGNATDSLSASLGLQSSHNEMVRFLCADSDVLLEALGTFNELPEARRLEIATKLYHLYSHSELDLSTAAEGFGHRRHGQPPLRLAFLGPLLARPQRVVDRRADHQGTKPGGEPRDLLARIRSFRR